MRCLHTEDCACGCRVEPHWPHMEKRIRAEERAATVLEIAEGLVLPEKGDTEKIDRFHSAYTRRKGVKTIKAALWDLIGEKPKGCKPNTQGEKMSFEKALKTLINEHGQENDSNTPDWILAQYMGGCLATFNKAVQQRENWYGRDPRPSSGTGDNPATAKWRCDNKVCKPEGGE